MGVLLIYLQPLLTTAPVSGIDPINLAVLEDRYDALCFLLGLLPGASPADRSWILNNKQALFRCRSPRVADALIKVRSHLTRPQSHALLSIRCLHGHEPPTQCICLAQVVLDL